MTNVSSLVVLFMGLTVWFILLKDTNYSRENIRKTLERYTEESKKFSHSFGQNYGKTFQGGIVKFISVFFIEITN